MEHSINKNIGWQRILMLIIPYFMVVGTFQLIGKEIAGTYYAENDTIFSTETKLIVSGLDLIGTFIILFIFIKAVEHDRFINLGFQLKNSFRNFILGIFVGAFIIGTGYLILIYFKQIKFVNLVFEPQQLVYTVLLYLSVAIVEETLFRGYVLRNLIISFNKYTALIISSLIFALLHSINPAINFLGLVNLFLLGILLGVTYIHTKNLWFPIALHFSWNLVQTFLGFNVSGQNSYSLIETKMREENFINGGAFGFEGSILSVIFQVIFILGIGYYLLKKTKLIKQ